MAHLFGDDALAAYNAYIPYIQNTYFYVFVASSFIYIAAKLLTKRPPRRPSLAAPSAPAAPPRPPPIQAAAIEAIQNVNGGVDAIQHRPTSPRLPFLRPLLAFITYNLVVQLTLCLSFFALGSQHSAQRVFGVGAVALHLVSGGAFLLACFALLAAMIALGFFVLVAKYSAAYVGGIVRELSVWRRDNQ